MTALDAINIHQKQRHSESLASSGFPCYTTSTVGETPSFPLEGLKPIQVDVFSGEFRRLNA